MGKYDTAEIKIDEQMSMCTPWGVAMSLGIVPYKWQLNVWKDIIPIGSRVALKAANGSGKTDVLVASIVLWHALAFKGSITVITSGAWRQVKDQLFPSIKRHSEKFPGWKFNDHDFTTPDGSVCVGFSTDDAGKFEGYHAKDVNTQPLLIVIDEAKSVKEDIFHAKARCQPTRELIVSSPGGSTGEFYNAFNKKAGLYKTHTVTAYDCPHISRKWIDEQIAEYGIDHPLVRSMVFAEFMDMGEDGTVIPLGVLERNYNTLIQANTSGEVHAFCDFAAGGDENVLAIRRGNVCEIVKAWRETNTMIACGEFISMFNRLNLKPEWISGDAGGMGKVWCDRFAELGWNINRVNFGGKPDRKDMYSNRAAEIWGEGARCIENKKYILPKNDDIFKKQIISRKWEGFYSDGKLRLESKEKMRSMGIHSPDRAEAVLGTMLPSPSKKYSNNNSSSYIDMKMLDDYDGKDYECEKVINSLGMDVGY